MMTSEDEDDVNVAVHTKLQDERTTCVHYRLPSLSHQHQWQMPKEQSVQPLHQHINHQ
jgi:hypothetical protein